MKKRMIPVLTALVLILPVLSSCGKKEAPRFYLAETVTTMHTTGQVNRIVNEFDEDWNVIAAVNYTNGQETSRTLYEIADGVTRITTVQDGVSELQGVTVTDKSGHTTHSEVYLNGEVSNTVDNTYDADGHLLTSERRTAGQDQTYRCEYTNNDAGQKVREDVYSGGGLDHYTVYTYDEAGRVLTDTTCQSDGTETGWQKYTYEEAEDGTLIQKAYQCDASGTQQSLRAVCVYDKYENLLSQEIYMGGDTPFMTLAMRYVTGDGTVSSGIAEE